MKNLLILLAASTCFISCASVSGNGDVREESRNISDIHSVKSSGSIDVEIKSGNTYALVVENDENLLQYVITDVDNGVLNIH